MHDLGCHSACRPNKRRKKLNIASADLKILKQHLHLSSSSGKWLVFPHGSRPWHPASCTTQQRRCKRGLARLRASRAEQRSRRSKSIPDVSSNGSSGQAALTAVINSLTVSQWPPGLGKHDMQHPAAVAAEPGLQPSSNSSSVSRMSPPLPCPATPTISTEGTPWQWQQQQQQQQDATAVDQLLQPDAVTEDQQQQQQRRPKRVSASRLGRREPRLRAAEGLLQHYQQEGEQQKQEQQQEKEQQQQQQPDFQLGFNQQHGVQLEIMQLQEAQQLQEHDNDKQQQQKQEQQQLQPANAAAELAADFAQLSIQQPQPQQQHAQQQVVVLDSDGGGAQQQQQQQQQHDDDDGPIVIDSSDGSDDDNEQQHAPIPPLQAAGAAAVLAVRAPAPGNSAAAEAYIAAVAAHVPSCVQHPQPSSLASGLAASWQAVEERLAALQGHILGRCSRGHATKDMTRKDFSVLMLPREWLNDELLNYYLLLLQLRSDAILQLQTQLHAVLQQLGRPRSSLPQPLRVLLRVPRSYAFNSFFYAQLAPRGGGYCYAAVQRWTQQRRTRTPECVLSYELLLFPVNLRNTHWAVAAVWPQAGVLQYLDSLGQQRTGRPVLAKLARWLLQDAADKGVALPYTPQEMRLELAPQGMPAQLDGNSCGVFAAAVCERLAAGWVTPFEFSQGDIPHLRLGMAIDMLDGAVGW